jgi:hypothetical protein
MKKPVELTCCLLHTGLFLSPDFYPENGGDMFLWNSSWWRYIPEVRFLTTTSVRTRITKRLTGIFINLKFYCSYTNYPFCHHDESQAGKCNIFRSHSIENIPKFGHFATERCVIILAKAIFLRNFAPAYIRTFIVRLKSSPDIKLEACGYCG